MSKSTYESHFKKSTVKALKVKGIEITGGTYVPGPGGSYTNGETAYILNDNGTQKIRSYREVLDIAN